ncbi:unnamed protein product [Fraxinus pennsylvanica]|uniref:Uncharacterized protein n=1 Tax=Fraxinus pennsylvanica TaxID=56036 RepID=A0AAD2DMB7_9LAMI|nr:unnamed protein product [Fraxinus pennsylvanica]
MLLLPIMSVPHGDKDLLDLLLYLLYVSPIVYKAINRLEDHVDFMGRSDNALRAIEKAGRIDPVNVEISVILNNVKLVGRARARGNDLFKSERYTEACSAYAEGLRHDPLNPILYCNRAACWFRHQQIQTRLIISC